LRIGSQSLSPPVVAYYNVEKLDGTAHWALQAQVEWDF